MEPPQVTVEQGTLQGRIASTPTGTKYYSFEGISYAKPPIGPFRFREPQVPEKWNGVREATKPGNRCAQSNPFTYKFVGSEDCLYLNIYTPCLPASDLEALPVIFYIHGGRLFLGYGEYYQPDYFIDRNVILVTINYRLGVFGFLALDIPKVPGNAGLKDAAFALKWVNKNIAKFGGDENNLTVMGESAGAGIAASFLTTDLTEGLFQKAILESGNSVADLFMEDRHIDKARRFVRLFDKEIDDPNGIYEFLRTVSAEDLVQAVGVTEMQKEEIKAYFLPVVEKKFDNVKQFFKEYPHVSLKENRFIKVPMISGTNTHEGALFLERDADGNYVFREDLEFFLPKLLHLEDKPDLLKKMRAKIKRFYFGNKKIGMETIKEYIDLMTDSYFLSDTYMFHDLIAKYNEDVYSYRFCYSGNLSLPTLKSLGLNGASHADIVQYQFYRKHKADKISSADEQIINFLTETWTNFVKNGKPTWSGQKTGWLPYNIDEKFHLDIDTELKLSVYPDRRRREFWKDLLTPYSKM